MLAKLRALLARPARPAWQAPYDPAATEADILACFRLLLGRHPNPEEWAGHASRAGRDLPPIVSGYLNSLEFTRRGLMAPDPSGAPVLAQADGFQIYAMPSDAAVGRHVAVGEYEADVTAVFRRVLRPGMGVLDIGANIGWFTMLSASLVGPGGFVLAMEPNPANARLLEASRRLNGFAHVMVSQTAAGQATGLLALYAQDSNGMTAAPPDTLDGLLAARTVPCVPADALVPTERPIGLVKVDVEGAEYLALKGAEATLARNRPVVISEFSPSLMPGISGVDGTEYLRWLAGLGYALAVVLPDGSCEAMGTGAAVMAAWERRGTDHIDIVATPT